MNKLAGLFVLVNLTLFVACGDSDSKETFYFSGIPDQDAARLSRRYDEFSDYLSGQLGVTVKYKPAVDYAAVVTAFDNGDIQMGWFGGLTGVQARLTVPDSQAIAQRPRDAEFHSRFIVQSSLEVDSLEDLKGLSFTFGDENSTSGHLMPRHFLLQAGVDPEGDFPGGPNFSGSHDLTWKLVESGAFQAGALNETVWQSAVDEGKVDLTKVREFHTTPGYYDYNWTIRGDADETFGEGFTDKVKKILISIGADRQDILDLFDTESFIESDNENYRAIREVAEQVGIIK